MLITIKIQRRICGFHVAQVQLLSPVMIIRIQGVLTPQVANFSWFSLVTRFLLGSSLTLSSGSGPNRDAPCSTILSFAEIKGDRHGI